MTSSITATHVITIDLPMRQCQMLFTPAGEERWVDGWQPRYLHPQDGQTVQGMVFITGVDDELTVWTMTEFSRQPCRARYARVTPASRWGFVDVECTPLSEQSTQVRVSYTMHALTAAGVALLGGFEPAPFAAMINEWKDRIDARLDELRDADIR